MQTLHLPPRAQVLAGRSSQRFEGRRVFHLGEALSAGPSAHISRSIHLQPNVPGAARLTRLGLQRLIGRAFAGPSFSARERQRLIAQLRPLTARFDELRALAVFGSESMLFRGALPGLAEDLWDAAGNCVHEPYLYLRHGDALVFTALLTGERDKASGALTFAINLNLSSS